MTSAKVAMAATATAMAAGLQKVEPMDAPTDVALALKAVVKAVVVTDAVDAVAVVAVADAQKARAVRSASVLTPKANRSTTWERARLRHPWTAPTRPRTTPATSHAQSAAHATSAVTAQHVVENAVTTRNATSRAVMCVTRHAPTDLQKFVATAPPKVKPTATVTRVAKAVVVVVVAVDVVAMTVVLAKTTPAEMPTVTLTKHNWVLQKPTTATLIRLAQHSQPWPTVQPHLPATRTRTDADHAHETAMDANVVHVLTAVTREIATTIRPKRKPQWKRLSSPLPRSQHLRPLRQLHHQ
jgi:hypothetical protein